MILTYGHDTLHAVQAGIQSLQIFCRPNRSAAPMQSSALEKPLMTLVDFFKSAAQGYGTEKRILLLHGPVGSSKSTIARLLKKGN